MTKINTLNLGNFGEKLIKFLRILHYTLLSVCMYMCVCYFKISHSKKLKVCNSM